MGRHKFVSLLLLTTLFAVAVRLAVIAAVPTAPTSDFWSYFQRATSIADSGTYQAVVGRPDASYPPGYSLLLAALFKIPGDRLYIAKLANVAMGLASVVLAALLTRDLFGDRAGIFAAVIVATSPRAILSSVLIASENAFLPLLFAWVFSCLRGFRKSSPTGPLVAGAVAGLATLVRVVAAGLSGPWLLSVISTRGTRRAILISLSLFLGAQAAVLAPWTVRNLLVLGAATPFTTTAGINLFIGNNSHATGEWYPWLGDILSADPLFETRPVAQQDAVARRLALRWIAANPGKAASLYIEKLGLSLKDDAFAGEAALFGDEVSPPQPPVDVLPTNFPHDVYRPLVETLLNIFYWGTVALALAGAALALASPACRRRQGAVPAFVLLLGSATYFPIVSAIFLASTRFHWPSVDLLVPFAAAMPFLARDAIVRGRTEGAAQQLARADSAG